MRGPASEWVEKRAGFDEKRKIHIRGWEMKERDNETETSDVGGTEQVVKDK
jgi:hypothetical protein